MTLRWKSALSAAVLGITTLANPACKTGSPPAESPNPARKEPQVRRTDPPPPATPPAKDASPAVKAEPPREAPVPAAAKVPASDPAAAASDGSIQPGTKRSAAGLPDPVTGYASWFGLGHAASAPEGTTAEHAPARKAYIQRPNENDPAGKALPTPLLAGTIVVLEEKAPGKEFITRINVMMKEEGGWKYIEYARDAMDRPFVAATGSEADCAACHAKAAATDSVFSKLVLED